MYLQVFKNISIKLQTSKLSFFLILRFQQFQHILSLRLKWYSVPRHNMSYYYHDFIVKLYIRLCTRCVCRENKLTVKRLPHKSRRSFLRGAAGDVMRKYSAS